MAQNVNPTFVKTPNYGTGTISTGTLTASAVTVYTGAANGSKISALVGVSVSTTASYDVNWGISSGGGSFAFLGVATVPANAGFIAASGPSVNFFSNANVPLAVDSDGNPFVILPSSAHLLQVRTQATSSTWTAFAIIAVTAPSVGDF